MVSYSCVIKKLIYDASNMLENYPNTSGWGTPYLVDPSGTKSQGRLLSASTWISKQAALATIWQGSTAIGDFIIPVSHSNQVTYHSLALQWATTVSQRLGIPLAVKENSDDSYSTAPFPGSYTVCAYCNASDLNSSVYVSSRALIPVCVSPTMYTYSANNISYPMFRLNTPYVNGTCCVTLANAAGTTATFTIDGQMVAIGSDEKSPLIQELSVPLAQAFTPVASSSGDGALDVANQALDTANAAQQTANIAAGALAIDGVVTLAIAAAQLRADNAYARASDNATRLDHIEAEKGDTNYLPRP